MYKVFQSTPLTRGETSTCRPTPNLAINFNPLPSHEGRHALIDGLSIKIVISIHSPHTRGDQAVCSFFRHGRLFQSTPLTRGETNLGSVAGDYLMFISIHSPHTRGDPVSPEESSGQEISIHSPHTRGDIVGRPLPAISADFNPLPSHEGRRDEGVRGLPGAISIRSPHTRGDRTARRNVARRSAFQSAPLTRGETALIASGSGGGLKFQSAPLTRGETGVQGKASAEEQFQSAPLTRGETVAEVRRIMRELFQSTPLTRGETYSDLAEDKLDFISIHSPHPRGDMSRR